MDVQILCAAVQEAPAYLSRFTRKEYPLAFREYAERFAPVWTAAVRETAGEETALTVLADNFLEGLEQGWRRQRFWNRSSVRVNEKQMVVGFPRHCCWGWKSRCARSLPRSCGTAGPPAGPGTPTRPPPMPTSTAASATPSWASPCSRPRTSGRTRRKKSKKFEKTV